MVRLAALTTLAALAALAGGCRGDSGPPPAPQGYLFEKGPYQGFYNPQGRLMRLLYDQNGDRKADVVMIFHPNGALASAEADTDHDGVSDTIEAPVLSAFEDLNGDGLVDRFNPALVNFATDFITDPTNPAVRGCKDAGVLAYASANRAVTSLAHLWRYARWRHGRGL